MTQPKEEKKSCQPSDLKERAFTHGGYLCLTLLQVTFYFPVHLPDKRLQLSIQFAVAHGEAVGMFRQAAALRLLLCNLLCGSVHGAWRLWRSVSTFLSCRTSLRNLCASFS